MRGHIGQREVMAFACLLPLAGFGQAHDLHPQRVFELGEWQVVEGDVAVLAVTWAAQVGRVPSQ